jgi:hypothetical protein
MTLTEENKKEPKPEPPPFNHYFKHDELNKYTLVYHHKISLNITNTDKFIYLCTQYRDFGIHKIYKFFKVPLYEIDYFCNLLKSNNNLFEILISNKTIKPFLDLEKSFIETRTEEENETLLNKFMSFYKKIYKKCFNISILDEQIIILNSCGIKADGTNKFSYHMIINNNVYFKNMKEQLIFQKYLYNCILQTGDKELLIMDNSVYSHDRYMRMINQCKHDEPKRPLINNDVSIKDTFLINYFVNNETKYLNVDTLKDDLYKINNHPSKKLKSSKQQNEPLILYDDDDKQRYNELLNLLNPLRFEDRNEWIIIGMALKSINDDYIDLYIEYSKQSSHFQTEKYIIDAWHSFKKEGLNKYKLYDFAKIDNKKLFYKWLSKWNKISNFRKYESYVKVNTSNIKRIVENSRWFSEPGTEHENNIYYDAKHVILDAYMGVGKTQATIRLIKSWKRI